MRVLPKSVGIIHFIGIGGIGMSGIAEILHSQGYSIQGSDTSEGYNIQRLRSMGILCHLGHRAESVEDVAVVVVSSAIRPDNPELVRARQRKIPIVKRAEMLAEIMRLRPSIVVAGSHGKTTTTSLGAWVLDSSGYDPTIVSGGIINAYGTNARLGGGDWTIVEADESDGTFTKLPATIAIVTNIDPEHMEYYHTDEQLILAFQTFVENIPFYGLGILCQDHPVVAKLAQHITDRRIVTYGFDEKADVRAVNVRPDPKGFYFDVLLSEHFSRVCPQATAALEGMQLSGFFLPMVGQHNVANALSIITMALEVGVPVAQIQKGLAAFTGVKRRFTQVGTHQDVTYIDDYAHHPEEIKAVTKAARDISEGRVVVVMQPHRYSRLSHLFDDFAQCFKQADLVYIVPIYGAGEPVEPGLTHHKLAAAAQAHQPAPVAALDSQEQLHQSLLESLQPHDIVLFLGAGDITKWAYQVYDKMVGAQSIFPLETGVFKQAG